MNKKQKQFFDVIIRYTILLLAAFPSLYVFYFIFTPLTVYPVYFLLSLFFDASLTGNIILLEEILAIELIAACIAGSAYYLLLILNLSTSDIKLKKRINMLLIAFLAFLVVNTLRIFSLSIVAFSGYSFFDITHAIFWYLVSTVFVAGIWFFEVKYFKIKEIPFYSDLKMIYNSSSLAPSKNNKK